MQKYDLEIWPDTRANLDAISEVSKISTAELVRRGAECAIILYDVPTEELSGILQQTLGELQQALGEDRQNLTGLVSSLSKGVALAAALSAIYIMNEGKDSRNALQIYGDSLREHLVALTMSQVSNFGLNQKDRDILKGDVDSFLNLMKKMQALDKDSANISGSRRNP